MAATEIIYISGPMSGLPEHNYPAFNAKARELRAQGHEVINPAELPEPAEEQPWDWYLRRDLAELVKCTHVVLLPGWSKSRGAQLEYGVAVQLGMHITYPVFRSDPPNPVTNITK
ncbi:hypothetical protein B5566_02620 [Mycobacterium sp. MHSD3]|nr:hypothetical protein B5566_02620 [Mycobacterium sp. MHSD3]